MAVPLVLVSPLPQKCHQRALELRLNGKGREHDNDFARRGPYAEHSGGGDVPLALIGSIIVRTDGSVNDRDDACCCGFAQLTQPLISGGEGDQELAGVASANV